MQRIALDSNYLLMGLAVFVASLFFISTAFAAPPTGNKITCFGDCVQLSPNKVHVNNQGGAYIPGQGGTGTLLGDVTKLSFNYSGSGAVAGSPRFSIAVDPDGADQSSADDIYVFADLLTCNNGSTEVGIVDVINDSTCPITAPDGTWPNWAAYAAAHPGYTLGWNYSFIISDDPNGATPSYDIWNVQITTKSRGGK